MMFFGILMLILLWGTLIFLIVLEVRRPGGPSENFDPLPEEDALESLRELYALGKINREEYEEKRRLLTKRLFY